MREQALADALRVVQLLDEQHLQRLTEFQLKFYDVWRPHERPAVVRHRDEIREILAGASAVAIAGGHVGEPPACCTCSTSRRTCRLAWWPGRRG